MITVKVVRDQSRKVTGLFVSGHSGYAEAGSDIICAGVCAEIIIPEGRFRDEGAADRAQVIMETIVLGFISLAQSVNTDGNRYISITEEI